MKNSNCNYYYYEGPSQPAHPFCQAFLWAHAHLYKQFARFIHSFIHSFVRSLRTWFHIVGSILVLAFSLYPFHMHCSGWVHSNDTPFDATVAGYYCYYYYYLRCVCTILLHLSPFPPPLILCVKFISIIVQVILLGCFLILARNRNWCTFRVDCLTEWYGGVENVVAYVFIMNRESLTLVE